MGIDKQIAIEFLDKIIYLYASKDPNYPNWISNCFISPFVVFGTAKDEIRQTKDEVKKQFERDFAEIGAVESSYEIINFDTSGDTCWCGGFIDMKVTNEDSMEVNVKLRFTMVFQEVESILYLRQMHLSMPDAGSEVGKSFQTKLGIYDQIQYWIEQFNIDPKFSQQSRQDKIIEYLVKAQNLIKSDELQIT